MKQKLDKDSTWNPSEVSHDQIYNAYHLAIESMATLNRVTAKLLKKYDSHGATDVTGFGILGHGQNLASA